MKLFARSARPLPACLLLLALVGPAAVAQEPESASAPRGPEGSPPPAAGHWEGAIELPGAELGITVDLARGEDGWRGEIDIPAQGVSDRALAEISTAGDSVSFALAGIAGHPTFRGRVTVDSLAGTFSQSGQRIPFRLRRAGPPATVGDGPPPQLTIEEALASFDSLARAALETFRVPGAAVAIVRDGEVVHAAGYGVRNRGTGAPATPGTAMPIGSATKAFTSLLIGKLVEEGRLDWNEPVRSWLPDFRLQNDFATEEMTPVDLLTHRSGLPRHDLVWYGADTGREDLYHRLRHLEPSASFRSAFQYNNLMYMTAGYLAGRVTGSSWEELVRQRILHPLGMTHTSLTIRGLEEASEPAVGYREEDREGGRTGAHGDLVPMDYRELDAMGPAGSINSTARDMARWVLLQLGGGELDGTRIASGATVAKTHTPEIVVEGGIVSVLLKQPEMPYLMYGLGWFVQPYRGHRMIHHGGNIDGFSALVSFLPDDDVGIVVLTNRNGTPLPTVLALGAYDRLLGLDPVDWSGRYEGVQERLEKAQQAGRELEGINRQEGTRTSYEVSEYAGTYRHPAYGELRIEEAGDSLLARYHGFSIPLGHWHHDVFRGHLQPPLSGDFRFQFRSNLRGDVAEVAVPFEPAVSPIVFERQPPEELSRPDYLERFTGRYRLAGLGIVVTVELRDGRLTLVVPGQPTYELAPYRGTEFDVVDQSGYGVRFTMEGDRVRELLLLQPNGVFRAEPVTVEEGADESSPGDSSQGPDDGRGQGERTSSGSPATSGS